MDQQAIKEIIEACGFTPYFNDRSQSQRRDKGIYAYISDHGVRVYLGSISSLSKKSRDELSTFIAAKMSNGGAASEVRR